MANGEVSVGPFAWDAGDAVDLGTILAGRKANDVVQQVSSKIQDMAGLNLDARSAAILNAAIAEAGVGYINKNMRAGESIAGPLKAGHLKLLLHAAAADSLADVVNLGQLSIPGVSEKGSSSKVVVEETPSAEASVATQEL